LAGPIGDEALAEDQERGVAGSSLRLCIEGTLDAVVEDHAGGRTGASIRRSLALDLDHPTKLEVALAEPVLPVDLHLASGADFPLGFSHEEAAEARDRTLGDTSAADATAGVAAAAAGDEKERERKSDSSNHRESSTGCS
jgi:hypothetical protein